MTDPELTECVQCERCYRAIATGHILQGRAYATGYRAYARGRMIQGTWAHATGCMMLQGACYRAHDTGPCYRAHATGHYATEHMPHGTCYRACATGQGIIMLQGATLQGACYRTWHMVQGAMLQGTCYRTEHMV